MKRADFDALAESIKQAGAVKRGVLKPGRVTSISVPDVKSIRKRLHLSQNQFALMIGVNVRTLQNWEQKRRIPEGPARALLVIAAKQPKAVLEALHNDQY